MIATLLKERLPNFNGHANLYHVDPPMKTSSWDDDDNETTEFVIVSAVYAMFSGPETYIFPADKDGKITSWSELPGSYRGGYSHEEALSNAGYTIADEPLVILEPADSNS